MMSTECSLLLATRNQGKRRELETILKGLPCRIVTLEEFPDAPEVVEDRSTFLDNARKKAQTLARHTGLLTLAEDSGLEVDALDGRPGVYSARYARGEGSTDAENIERVLLELQGVPLAKRTARFVCQAVLYESDKEIGQAFGEVCGLISENRRGHEGFGYDPIFYLPEYGKTFGELPASVKNRISHRSAALRVIRVILEGRFRR